MFVHAERSVLEGYNAVSKTTTQTVSYFLPAVLLLLPLGFIDVLSATLALERRPADLADERVEVDRRGVELGV